MVFVELATLFLTLFVALIFANNKKRKDYPDGPFRFPVIGNLPQFMWHSRIKKLPRTKLYAEYRRKYGKVYSIKMGPFP